MIFAGFDYLNVFTCIIGFLILVTIYWYATIPNNIPPGPLGLPIVGNLPFVGKKPHVTFSKFGNKYGPVFSIYLGSKLAIILNDFKAIKDAFATHGNVFSERPEDSPVNPTGKNIVGISGPDWKEHRRFTLATLKNFGVGKPIIEERLLEEINNFTKYLTTLNGTASDFSDIIRNSISNNIVSIVFGRRFDYDDPKFTRMTYANDEFLKLISTVSLWVFFPWMKIIPGFSILSGQRLSKQLFEEVEFQFVKPLVEEHKVSQAYANEDYVYAYLDEQTIRKSSDNIFTDESLYINAHGLLAAGSETTNTLLRWILIYMIRYPEIQNRIQNEIDLAIGRDRDPCYDDRLRTPLTEATIMEVSRIKTLVPLNIPHSNRREGYLNNYRIPKNSYILSNLWHVHNDPNLWGDPENFRPERFLNENGEVVKPEYFIPFSIGKRYCVGEILARMELYLYFTCMMQKFTFSAPDGTTASEEEILGLVISPKVFKPLITLRK